jgi:hypothetical protein
MSLTQRKTERGEIAPFLRTPENRGGGSGGSPVDHPLTREVGAGGGEGQREHRRASPHQWVAEEWRKVVDSGLAMCVGGPPMAVLAAAAMARASGGERWRWGILGTKRTNWTIRLS